MTACYQYQHQQVPFAMTSRALSQSPTLQTYSPISSPSSSESLAPLSPPQQSYAATTFQFVNRQHTIVPPYYCYPTANYLQLPYNNHLPPINALLAPPPPPPYRFNVPSPYFGSLPTFCQNPLLPPDQMTIFPPLASIGPLLNARKEDETQQPPVEQLTHNLSNMEFLEDLEFNSLLPMSTDVNLTVLKNEADVTQPQSLDDVKPEAKSPQPPVDCNREEPQQTPVRALRQRDQRVNYAELDVNDELMIDSEASSNEASPSVSSAMTSPDDDQSYVGSVVGEDSDEMDSSSMVAFVNTELFPKKSYPLWQFLLVLLLERKFPAYIDWIDRDCRKFKLVNPEAVARLWGLYKGCPAMNYAKLSRGLRYYYPTGIVIKATGVRYSYEFKCRKHFQCVDRQHERRPHLAANLSDELRANENFDQHVGQCSKQRPKTLETSKKRRNRLASMPNLDCRTNRRRPRRWSTVSNS